jgi:DNA polymerase III alpha subunit
LSFCIYITDADPLKYELLFERMLHILKKKNDIPDIDVDFESGEREKLVKYVKEKY